MKTLAKYKSKALLADLLAGGHDVLQLGRMHKLSPEELAAWVSQPHIQQTMAGLCALSDYQTQLMLTQYRRFAATRLIRLATGEDSQVSEPSRKACVDLLRTELRRVADSPVVMEEETPAPNVVAMQRELYGGASEES